MRFVSLLIGVMLAACFNSTNSTSDEISSDRAIEIVKALPKYSGITYEMTVSDGKHPETGKEAWSVKVKTFEKPENCEEGGDIVLVDKKSGTIFESGAIWRTIC